ncbi:MAG TPA: PAC2 family protein [Acidimicrobiia bacterium]|nr:PAC2 family protein [Acidimicrobiia bacterium]
MSIFTVAERPELIRPALVICLNGWVNAGSAATLVADTIGGETIASGDSDLLFDYRVTRPTLDFVEGVMTRLVWPDLSLRRFAAAGRDLLLLVGTEPNWNWRRLGNELSQLAVELGVDQQISVGAVPWAWPHTRPVPIIATASDRAHLPEGDERPEGLLRVPSAAVSTLEYMIAGTGIPTVGFYARVPQYVGVEYPAAALALIRRLEQHLRVSLPVGDLEEQAAAQRTELDEVSASRTDVRTMIEQLEAMVDAARVVSGEQLAAEIERFLRGQP